MLPGSLQISPRLVKYDNFDRSLPSIQPPLGYTILPVQAAKETLAVNFVGAQRLTEVLLPELHLDDEKNKVSNEKRGPLVV